MRRLRSWLRSRLSLCGYPYAAWISIRLRLSRMDILTAYGFGYPYFGIGFYGGGFYGGAVRWRVPRRRRR